MARYIDADAIHEKYDEYANFNYGGRGNGKTLARFLTWIDEQPTADVRENVKGEWIELRNGVKRCSVCGFTSNHLLTDNFCPNCGAEMSQECNR